MPAALHLMFLHSTLTRLQYWWQPVHQWQRTKDVLWSLSQWIQLYSCVPPGGSFDPYHVRLQTSLEIHVKSTFKVHFPLYSISIRVCSIDLTLVSNRELYAATNSFLFRVLVIFFNCPLTLWSCWNWKIHEKELINIVLLSTQLQNIISFVHRTNVNTTYS